MLPKSVSKTNQHPNQSQASPYFLGSSLSPWLEKGHHLLITPFLMCNKSRQLILENYEIGKLRKMTGDNIKISTSWLQQFRSLLLKPKDCFSLTHKLLQPVTIVISMKSITTLLVFGLMLTPIARLQAEVYRWQDKNGRWQFSDKPFEGQDQKKSSASTQDDTSHPAAEKKTTEAVKSAANHSDKKTADAEISLQERMLEKFKPDSAVSRVTLSVVAIETHIGSGSGFFISDQGHIITNKHVIRPMAGKASEENEKKLKDEAAALARAEAEIQQEKKELANFKNKLDDMARNLNSLSKGNSKDSMQSEYDTYLSRYTLRWKSLEKYQQEYNTRKKSHDKIQSDLNWTSSLAKVAQQFKVFLKDNTKLTAKLLSVSKNQDLALLQIEDVKTVGLKFYTLPLNQGTRVYAIGSPLGMRDSMTSGIITRLDSNYVTTDAQILPGNSGGPLVTEDGQVIGVNTIKFAENVNGAGFGMAIPVSEIQKEFKNYLPKAELTN